MATRTHLGILQAEIGHPSLRCSLALGEVLVDLIDAISNVIVCFVE